MLGMTRGVATLIGAAVAGFLIWLAAQLGTDTAGEYWASYGVVGAAGLAMALSQVLGGWTKWGWPRLSLGVFVIGFLPVAVVGLWVLFAHQPGDRVLETASWSDDIGVGGAVSDLGEMLAAVAFLVGLTLGLTFDTAGREVGVLSWEPDERREPATGGAEAPAADRPDDDRAPADEPVAAEGREHSDNGSDTDAANPPRRVIRP
jgi:hypothetical protein